MICGTKKRQKQNIKNDGLSKFLGRAHHILDDASDPPRHRDIWACYSRSSFVSFWWPRRSAKTVPVTSSSLQALILVFLATRIFFMPLVLF
jgi:hypothetical protein